AVDFGILVDGAVVLVENVLHELALRRPKNHHDMLSVILHSALDVSKPTLFAMMIIIAALIPVFSLERVEGRIFRPLSLTYSFALGGALIFALTVVPALLAVVLRERDADVKEPKVLETLREWYARSLEVLLKKRRYPALAALVLAGCG